MTSASDEIQEERFTALDGAVLHDQVVGELMSAAQVGIWRFDPDTDTYYFSSELDLGYEQGITAVPRSTLLLVQHPADAPVDAAIRERLTTEVGEAETEMRYRHSAGYWVHLKVHYRTGRQLPSGRYEMYGISQNITAEAKARDAARASSNQVAMALSAAHAGVFEHNYVTHSYSSSEAFIKLVGRRGATRAKRDPITLYHPDDRQRVIAFSRNAVDAGRSEPIDVRVMGPKGYFWTRLFYEVEKNAAGKPIHGVGLLLDIDIGTRRKIALKEALEAAEAANSAKSDFLASVSHKIRTPLNGVSGILHLLKNEPLSDSARELVDQALNCGEMLAQLINDILDFSKIEAGKLEINPAATDIKAAITSVVDMMAPSVEAKGLYLRAVVPNTAGWAMVDPLRLRQCLFNIAGNAAKFTAEGGVEIRLSLIGQGPDQRLRCEVEDTGIGISREAGARLFDRFQQADSGTTRKFGGTGLGLAISRSLARAMGGDMGFDSTLGQGSTFWFEIAAPACEAVAAAPELAGMDAPLEGLRILVVDDNAINLLVASKTIEAMGAVAQTADSGQASIEALGKADFDLVLMDINMPGMDGMEATRLIRALEGPMAGVPVIALTADVMSHQRQKYLAAGMNGVAPKPFSPTQLLGEIARLMAEPDDQARATG